MSLSQEDIPSSRNLFCLKKMKIVSQILNFLLLLLFSVFTTSKPHGGTLTSSYASWWHREQRKVQEVRCPVEWREFRRCFEKKKTPASDCQDCVQRIYNLADTLYCIGFNSAMCQAISTNCPSCDGCEHAFEKYLICEFSLLAHCALLCNFANPDAPADCSAEESLYTECFETKGAIASTCTQCMQEKFDATSVSYCGEYAESLCPAIESECASCQGCERPFEDFLACTLASSALSCPFYCGLECFPRPPNSVPPPIACNEPSPELAITFTFEAENAANLVDSFLSSCDCCRVTDDLNLLELRAGYVNIETLSGTTAVGYFDGNDFLAFGPFEFESGISCARVAVRYARGTEGTGKVSLSLDSPNGPWVGELEVPSTASWDSWMVAETAIPFTGSHSLYFVGHEGLGLMNFDWVQVTSGITTSGVATQPTAIPSTATTPPTTSPVVAPGTTLPTVMAVGVSGAADTFDVSPPAGTTLGAPVESSPLTTPMVEGQGLDPQAGGSSVTAVLPTILTGLVVLAQVWN